MARTEREPSVVYGPWQNRNLRILEPGQDFIDGILYLTVPQFRIVQKKNKEGTMEPHIEKGAAVITSDRQFFSYDKTNLYDKGFAFPDTFTVNDEGWGGQAAQAWVDGLVEPPEAWDLYQRMRNVYTTYIEYSDEMLYDLMSLYIIATYFYKVFDTFGYTHFNGTKESGKSQNLRISDVLGFNASLSANMTAPDLYRNIAGNPGVTNIDEAENFRGERGDALKEILKSGYNKGVKVSRQRQMPDGKYVADKFNVYGPKMLASIAPLDPVTATRAIKIGMRPALRTIPEFKANKAPWAALRNDLYYFALGNAAHVRTLYEKWSETTYRQDKAPGIINRSWEVAAPVIVMADYIGGDTLVEPLIEWLTTYFENERKRDDSTDLIRTLVLSLPSMMQTTDPKPGYYYPLATILENFRTFMDADTTDKITSRTIAKWLTPLGFTDIRAVKGGKQVRIVEAELRTVFTDRRIEPREEDAAWLAGTIDWQTADRVQAEPEQTTVEF